MKMFFGLSACAVVAACATSANAQTIWGGSESFTFDKLPGADWTLEANQDRLTDNVWFTRQDTGPLYNTKAWLDDGADAVGGGGGGLFDDFWNDGGGGTRGAKWAILSADGAGIGEEGGGEARVLPGQWDDFANYGTLGDPANFFSFHTVASLILNLEVGADTIDPADMEPNGKGYGTVMAWLVGQDLGVWLVEDDIYLELTFTSWQSGQGGRNLGGDEGGSGGISYTRTVPAPGATAILALGGAIGLRRRRGRAASCV